MDFTKLSGPIIGAIIGYGTNWIAIKMLFRPLKPVKIGKFILPFTPGIIPKRKEILAKAVGDSVGNNLFTGNDLKEILVSEEIENLVVTRVFDALNNEKNIKQSLLEIIDEEKYEVARESIKLYISEKIKQGLIESGIGDIIVEQGENQIRNKVNGSMLKMFVTDDLIHSIVSPMGVEVEKYIFEHGNEKIIPVVDKEIINFEKSNLKNLMVNYNFEEEQIKDIIKEIYQNFVLNHIDNLLGKIDISKVVEEKINKMDVLELEKLILSIMKKELSAIVNLGALIGLILGTLNVFI